MKELWRVSGEPAAKKTVWVNGMRWFGVDFVYYEQSLADERKTTRLEKLVEEGVFGALDRKGILRWSTQTLAPLKFEHWTNAASFRASPKLMYITGDSKVDAVARYLQRNLKKYGDVKLEAFQSQNQIPYLSKNLGIGLRLPNPLHYEGTLGDYEGLQV